MRSPALILALILSVLVPAGESAAQNGPPADAHPRVREAIHRPAA